MGKLLLSCPHCGFSREILRERIPQTARSITCPGCQRQSPLAEAMSSAGEIVSENSSQSWKHWEELAGKRNQAEDCRQQAESPEGIAALLRAGWRIYQGKWFSLSVVYLYMLVLAALPWVAYWQAKTGGLSVAVRWQGSPLVLLLAAGFSALGGLLGSCSLLQVVVNERIGFGQALRHGLKYFPGFLVVICWGLFMVVGGGLLVIPGVLFAGLFAFAGFVFLHERESGLDALCLSAQYVRSALWSNLGSIALLLLLLAAGTIFFVIQIVVLPYILVCLYLLYCTARQQIAVHRVLAGPRFKRYFVLPVVFTYALALIGLSIAAAKQPQVAGFDIARLRQLADAVVVDSWKLSGVAPPGCGLVLEKTAFSPTEKIKVRLLPSSPIGQNYYLCVAAEGEGCKETQALDQEAQSQRLVYILAPKQRGIYQLRIYSDYDRTVAISSLNFQVI